MFIAGPVVNIWALISSILLVYDDDTTVTIFPPFFFLCRGFRISPFPLLDLGVSGVLDLFLFLSSIVIVVDKQSFTVFRVDRKAF